TLKAEFGSKLAQHDIANEEELQKQITEKKELIQSLESAGKHNVAQKRKASLSELELIHVLAEKVKALEPKPSNEEYLTLKAEFGSKLAEHDIASEGELLKQITEKKGLIQSLESAGKHNVAQKRKASLSELELIQVLAEKVKLLKPLDLNDECKKVGEQMSVDDLINNKPEDVESKTEPEMEKEQDDECPITKENLSNMYTNFSSLPSCSERHIIGLLFYVSLKCATKSIIFDCNIKVPDEIEKEMMTEIDCLRQRLKIEELQSELIQNLVETCSIYLKNEDWKSALVNLRKLLKLVSPLDIRELTRLVGKVDDATKLIKDKAIILLLGGTGAGKSTTIHFLGGSEMIETKVNDMNHIAATKIRNSDLKKITTAPYARSETRYISPVTLDLKDIGGRSNDYVILCDTPGFEDTSGPEVDIANGDYIEQVYNDSVGFVSKHLTEEYRAATSTLNRCLVNQTVVSDKDLQQYQACIQHSKEAEILRTDHLDKELVHSIAFIQYVYELVDTMCMDLKGMDIDNPLVKISLDKIKLLSIFFPELFTIYNNSYRLFTEKIDLVLNSFKMSVESNEFNDSASNMTKLRDSLTILADHVDYKKLEDAYKQTNEYFLKYLNNSVEKFNNTFNKKLDKNDIDNLNKCVSMLESVNNTFALHFHIPREELNQIYENISLKILNYFTAIVEKIDTAFENKIELSSLEQLMGELDSIRTITSFDIKTSQLYYSTLEKLIGYINQSSRDAEQLLTSLFRQEKVDTAKLVTCLMNLKNLQESVIQINLDLDNSSKIKDVHKIILQIKGLKHLDKIASDINKHIDEVNEWFIKITNDVFSVIQDTYNLEKWREQGNPTLDFNKAEKGLDYLYNCKNIPILFQSTCMLTLNSLEQFIEHYENFLQGEMDTSFEKIIHYQDKNKDEIFEKARILASRLQEIYEIKTQYKRVFSKFRQQTLIEEWTRKLEVYLNELIDDMIVLSRTNHADELNSKLFIAKALSRLDSFMNDKKFIDIYKEYQNILFTNTSDVCKKAIDAITTNNYDLVASEMAALQASDKVGEHFFQQARRAINIGLNDLLDETKKKAIMLGYNTEIEEINSIIENLKRMKKAQQFIVDYLDTPDDIDKCIVDVKNALAERIVRFIEGIKALITVNNFSEADRKIDSIIVVRTLLGTYCTPEVSRLIDELKTSLNNVVLTDIVKKYSEMDINKYTLNPPTDIFAKFGEVNSVKPIYHQAYNKIKEAILTKLRQELDNAKTKQPLSCDNIHIRNFESAIKYLPKEMKELLEIELKHCKEDIARLIQDHNNRVDDIFSSGDMKTMKTLLEEYQTSLEMRPYFNKGRDLVLKNIRDIVTKIKESFEKSDIADALLNVKTLHEYRVKFQILFTDVEQLCSEVKNQIKNVFSEAHHGFVSRFLDNDVPISTDEIVRNDSSTWSNWAVAKIRNLTPEFVKVAMPDSVVKALNHTNCLTEKQNSNELSSVKEVEKNFLCLIEFIKFSNENRDKFTDKDLYQPHLIDFFPEDFDKKLKTLNEQLVKSFSKREEQYKNALNTLDITSLKEVLSMSKQWDSLIEKMIKHKSIHYIIDVSENNISKTITKVTLFPQILDSINDKIEKLRDELNHQELINEETKGYSKQRDEFYRKLNAKFTVLRNAKVFSSYGIRVDIDSAETECSKSIESQVKNIYSSAEEFIKKFVQDTILSKSEYDSFNLHYNNMLSFKKEMKFVFTTNNKKVDEIESKLFEKIQTWERKFETGMPTPQRAKILIDMKRIANNIPSFRTKMNEKIDLILFKFKNSKKNSNDFGKLGIILNQEETGIGQSIVADHTAFQGYSLSLFNEKTQKHGIDYVLDNITGDILDKTRLKKRYDDFRRKYDELVRQYIKPSMASDQLIANTKLLTGDIKQQANQIDWDASIRNKIPELAAHIFALWTLQNAHHYFEDDSVENRNSYLLQPHAAQIISIFRMLGIDDTKEQLSNNIIQIGTGEGKSVILGAVASILALLGFDVCCACYSEYLSQRDYKAFISLFNSLGISSHIQYGTFNKLCEHIVNENGDIRQVVEQLILKDSNIAVEKAKIIKRPKILLIDEVDVFFSRDFYGNVYTPAVSLKEPTVTSLVDYIWTQRKSNLTLNKIKDTHEYRNCCTRFPKWELLIQEAIKDMLFDVNNFESHNYVIKEDKIGYIEQDNIIYNVVYGYKTLFAYYFEHEKGKISKESLKDNICIRIKCGSFSYAETSLQFKYIMGVTGTLVTLSDLEKAIIKSVYKIEKNTIIPSVFGKNNLRFTKKDDIKIENGDDYFNVIKREIDDRLVATISGKRAVLVFFESEKKLKEFYESKALELIKESVVYLTEEASSPEKEIAIQGATKSDRITLFTKNFGRGTDFICYDPRVALNGGIHVIQTFLSEEMSEEVQIKGRTARQGDYGSYCMILLDKDLEKYQIDRNDIENVRDGKSVAIRALTTNGNTTESPKKYDSVYDLLDDRRTMFFKTKYEANKKHVEEARKRHEVGQKFLSSLNSGNIDAIKQFLIEENKGVEGSSISRTICLMDATISMSHLLQKSKNTVGTMLKRASAILTENNINSDSFRIQFVVYRNYCCREDKILQHSPWETKADNLRAFMSTIAAEGGLGNEAIEIGLQYANKENERENITQVILIGDAPPNTKTEVNDKRKCHGEDYWKKTKFAQPTYYKDELEKLIRDKVPVHAFFVAKRAEQSFKEIANLTGGRCQLLDINSSAGSQLLTDLVTEEILRNVGGNSIGNALVEAYRNKFGKSYT
ncbi:unnamed protein product, partial [Rotaria sp. Silwood1]